MHLTLVFWLSDECLLLLPTLRKEVPLGYMTRAWVNLKRWPFSHEIIQSTTIYVCVCSQEGMNNRFVMIMTLCLKILKGKEGKRDQWWGWEWGRQEGEGRVDGINRRQPLPPLPSAHDAHYRLSTIFPSSSSRFSQMREIHLTPPSTIFCFPSTQTHTRAHKHKNTCIQFRTEEQVTSDEEFQYG